MYMLEDLGDLEGVGGLQRDTGEKNLPMAYGILGPHRYGMTEVWDRYFNGIINSKK